MMRRKRKHKHMTLPVWHVVTPTVIGCVTARTAADAFNACDPDAFRAFQRNPRGQTDPIQDGLAFIVAGSRGWYADVRRETTEGKGE